MLGLGALLALEITTSTPDALCPPLEEARAAVRTRVGEVRAAYQAEFSLVRADDGRQSLELVVREGDVVRLQRSLPIEGVGCEDAAQAIALVLERYFDTVESPASRHQSDVGPVPVSAETRPSHDASPTVNGGLTLSEQRFELRGGIDYDWEYSIGPTIGVGYFPNAWRIASRLRFGLALDGAAFLRQASESVREQEITASTWQGALSIPLRFELSTVALMLGPWAQLRMQRAEGKTLRNSNSAFRLLPGMGGALGAVWSFHRRWGLVADLSFGAQLTGLAPSFVLRQDAREPKPVLVPQAWFGQARVGVLVSL
jgi:hypothetical protein